MRKKVSQLLEKIMTHCKEQESEREAERQIDTDIHLCGKNRYRKRQLNF